MRALAILATAAVSIGGAVQAAPISYTVQNSVSGQVPQIASFNVAGFNNALGTLLSATYEWEFNVGSTGTIRNDNTTSAASFVVELAGTGFLSALSFTPSALFGSASDTESFANLAALGVGSFDLNVGGSGAGVVDLAAAIAGPLSVSHQLTGLTGVSDGSDFTLTTQSLATAVARVTYTYEAPPPPDNVIPLPAALPLLAGALGLLGVARLRRKV